MTFRAFLAASSRDFRSLAEAGVEANPTTISRTAPIAQMALPVLVMTRLL